MASPRDGLAANPFWVLGGTPTMTRGELERLGQKLLALLAVQAPGADRYLCPLGERQRTAEDVRAALAALRDPGLRLRWELFTSPAEATFDDADADGSAAVANAAATPAVAWPEALSEAGWRPR